MSSKIFRPIPRRHVTLNSPEHKTVPPLLSPGLSDETLSRTHSILNLTSSTLLGIFSPTDYDKVQESTLSPKAFGAETPQVSPSILSTPLRPIKLYRPFKRTRRSLDKVLRVALLFLTGIGYGLIIQHLHDEPQVAQFDFRILTQRKPSWMYLLLWGMFGVVFGSLLPLVDASFAIEKPALEDSKMYSISTVDEGVKNWRANVFYQDWSPVIRSVGAFVGIAYAIRKLPWSSTLQASLALSLVNPVLWYLIDRSKPGFILSLAIGATGTTLLLISKSKIMPSPSLQSPLKTPSLALLHSNLEKGFVVTDIIHSKIIEDAIWIMSVLFCSCVCFGNIGRKLAPSGGE
ncbi:Protein NSG2 [Golovinomyces cichoracearum]|uniref:Protein NSG2 n=1 Tax=Golovinomyces cichoracearum TaxID=62708 RepID=A0A420IFJ5_9PEZI|nr:Protein NSG2 [Golovinomyces cichoracearum]